MSNQVFTPEELAEILGLDTVTVEKTVTIPAPTTTGTFKAPSITSPSFVEPKWYKLLAYYLTSGAKRGCTLFGPRGCGKSTAIRHLAQSVNAQTVTLQCAANMQIDSLIGVWTADGGTMRFVDGPLTIAVRTGAWLIAEEGNVIHPAVWSATNTLTDMTGEGLRLPTGEVVPNHPDFRLVLLYNEGSQYQGTREVNAALKRRLPPVYATYPDDAQELRILEGLTGMNAYKDPVQQVQKLASMIRAGNFGFDLSPDILANLINVHSAGLGTWMECFEMCVLDLLGDPSLTQTKRAPITEIARNAGIDKW